MRRGSSGSAVMKAFGRLLVAAGALVTFSACFAAPPGVYSQSFGGQSCSGCHGTPIGTDSIIVNGSQTGSGAAIRTLMDNSAAAANQMDAILGFVSDAQLNTIRLWLIDARDGIFAVQGGSSTNFGSAAVGSNGSTQTFTITNERGNAAGFTTAPNTSGDFQITGGTCGATVAATSTCTVNVRFEPTASGVRNGSVFYRFSSGGTTTTQSISLTGTGFVPTPGFSRTPPTLTFVGRVSPLQTDSGVVTITNPGGATANLIFSAFNFSRPEFTRTGGTCAIGGLGIAPGVDCTVNVRYTPSAVGAQNGSMTILHNAASSPDFVTLNATGTQSLISPTATPLDFGNVQQGVPRALTLQIDNTGSATLTFTAPVPTAAGARTGAAAGDYAVSGCGASIAAGANCTLTITLTPSVLGPRPATLTVNSDATNGPLVVTLTGVGVALPEPVVTFPNTDFPDTVINETAAVTRQVTIRNDRTRDITYAIVPPTDFLIGAESCPGRLVPGGGGTCTVQIQFRPLPAGGEGLRQGTLNFSFAGTGGDPAPSNVSGAVQGRALLPLAQSATTLNAAAVVGSPTTVSMLLTNRSATPLTLTTLLFGGVAPGDYSLDPTNACTPGLALAASASCTLVIRFAPPIAGPRNATLAITHSAPGSPQSVTLLGTATPAPQGRIELGALSLTFADTQLGSTSTQSITVRNAGDLALTFSAFTFGGAAPAEFERGGDCSVAAPLAIGAQCTLTVTFRPAVLGLRNATLTIASDASNGPATLSLAGTGIPVPVPVVSLTPATLPFGTQTTGGIYPARRVRLANSGTADLAVSAIVVAGTGFSNVSAAACPPVLAPGAGCDIDIALAATSAIAYNGTLTVTSNAAGSPHTTLLTGTGTASAVPVLIWSPVVTLLDFGSVSAGSVSPVQSVTLLNQGPGGVNLTLLNAIGTDAASFSVVGGTCAIGAPLFEGETCRVDIRFAPGSAGAKSATVQVASTGSFPPVLALAGVGLAGPNPSIALSSTSLTFGVARVGTQSLPSELRLISNGSAAVRVTALVVTGAYTIQSSNCPSVPFTLVAGTQCTMAVAFVPSAEGASPGILRVTVEGDPVAHEVALSGNGEAEAEMSSGGCSLASGRTLLDPTLWLLTLLAAWVLLRRRRADRARPARSDRS